MKITMDWRAHGARALSLATLLALAGMPARAQLAQITSCVESNPGGSSTATRTGVDCNPQAAMDRAVSAARRAARDLRDSTCISTLTTASAAAICDAASGSVPGSSTSLQAEPFPAIGRDPVDASLGVVQTAPKLCTVLRDGVSSTTTRDNFLCIFDGFKETVATFTATARCGAQCFDVHEHMLKVRRFETTDFSSADADRVLLGASTVLQTDDGDGDVACSLTLARLGSVSTFSTGDGSLDTAAELSAVQNLSGNVKVVDAVNFCGQFNVSLASCAELGGNSFVIEQLPSDIDFIVWAHQFGHNQGLPDRNVANALMNGLGSTTNRRVTSAECSVFRDLDALTLTELLHASQDAAPEGFDTQAPDLGSFVRQVFGHGVPYGQASQFGADEVLGLQSLLSDPAQQAHWSNAATVLGMAGDERAVATLVGFISGQGGSLTREHYRAKTAAIAALGYLAHRTGSERAMAYLVDGLQPESWATRRVGQGPHQKSAVERDRDLAKYAIIGLALSGRPEALGAIETLHERAAADPEGAFPAPLAGVVAQALVEHEQVARWGLAGYYGAGE